MPAPKEGTEKRLGRLPDGGDLLLGDEWNTQRFSGRVGVRGFLTGSPAFSVQLVCWSHNVRLHPRSYRGHPSLQHKPTLTEA